MIPQEQIQKEIKKRAWRFPYQVEQDLLLDKSLVSIYSNELLRENLVFRGGTALNKLVLSPPSRYSEDLDFVQIKPARIGPIIDAIKESMQWLLTATGLRRPRINLGRGGTKILYSFTNIDGETSSLKIEINTKEHFQVEPLKEIIFSTNAEYFEGNALINTYQIEELMATKLRALYQRRKGRDLFDIWYVFSKGLADIKKSLAIFQAYNKYNKTTITKKILSGT